MKKNNAQISSDFLIVLSIALIIFLVFFSISIKRNDQLDAEKTKLYAKTLSDKLAMEINSMHLMGSGVQKTITFPNTLKDQTLYTLNIYPQSHLVVINWEYKGTLKKYQSSILTSNITGALQGINGSILILNLNGELILT
jgi:hypothetical protein